MTDYSNNKLLYDYIILLLHPKPQTLNSVEFSARKALS